MPDPLPTLLPNQGALPSTADAVEGMEHYLAGSLDSGATYRLRRRTIEAAGYGSLREWLDRIGRSIPSGRSSTVDVPLVPTLTPAVLEPEVASRLAELGPLLVAALRTSAQMLPQMDSARDFIGRGRRFEAGVGAAADPSLGHWIRVDYALQTDAEGRRRPIVFDVNLMPGMTHVTHTIDRVYRESFPWSAGASESSGYRRYDPTPIDRLRAHAAQTQGSDRVAFLVRGCHGLVPDVVAAAVSLEATTGVPGQVVEAATANWESACPGTVVRQMRRFSKHGSVDDVRELATLDALEAAAREQRTRALPGFHMGMESHAWPHYFRREPLRSVLVAALGERGYTTLVNALPETAIVDGEQLIWDDDRAEPLVEKAMKETVVKRSDSTGAEGVVVLSGGSRGRRRYREEMVAQLRLEGSGGAPSSWVVQKFVVAPKETYPVLNGVRELTSVTGTMRYAAYFASGEYLGGYALISPSSRMVHGGSDSHWVPIVEPVAASGGAGEEGQW